MTLTLSQPKTSQPETSHSKTPAIRGPRSFTSKLMLALALVALADAGLGGGRLGAGAAAFAAVWLLGLWLVRPAMRRSEAAMLAFGFAFAMALVLVEDPSPLAAALFWAAVSLAALLPRAKGFDDAWRWALRLALHTALTIAKPVEDIDAWLKTRRRARGVAPGQVLALLALPLGGAFVFAALFAEANPIFASWVGGAENRLAAFSLSPGRVALWGAVALVVWNSLRTSRLAKLGFHVRAERAARSLPGVSVASVTLSLVLFNALFAIENALDVAFLWSGAALPDGVTLASYAHQGAYPLIATALLAGGFVLVALRPGTPMAESRLIRGLVTLWIAQNLLLVASSGLRTWDYVEAYSLTRLRLAALIWMGLVALGLALICWRIVAAKSGAWLINANAAALTVTLAVCSVVDLGAVAAQWNVRRAIADPGAASRLDVQYLRYLGSSALPAMLEYERSPLPYSLRGLVMTARGKTERALEADQADWRSWSWRGARRLAEAQAAPPMPAPETPAVDVPPAPETPPAQDSGRGL